MTAEASTALRTRKHQDAGVHPAGRAAGPGDDRGPRRGERLPGLARRPDDRGHLSGGGHRHGGAAPAQGSILEENLARTAGSIGESVAAGAIFTIPAFVISRAWPSFDFEHAYWKSTALMMMGGMLGVLFVSLVRRVMVEDPELPFPESVAAAEIHKAGQRGGEAAKYLFYNMAFGGVSFLLGAFNLFAQDRISSSAWATWAARSCVWAPANGQRACRWAA